jgi:predicted RNase H-like nuclease (RuvC/YqgF family)
MKVVPLAIGILAASLATASTVLYVNARNDKLRSLAELAQARIDIAGQEKALAGQKELLGKAEDHMKELAGVIRDNETQLLQQRRRLAEMENTLLQAKGQLTLSTENEGLLNREIAGLKKDIDQLQRRLLEIDVLRGQLAQREQELALLRNRVGPDGRPIQVSEHQVEPRSVQGVGPQDAFVIVNLGSRQGATKGDRLLVRRGTDFIAVALISDVLDDLSIAQIDPGSLRESLRKGDGIVLAQPTSTK